MQARYGQQMGQPRIPHIVHDPRGDGAAFAGHERGGDRARLARQDGQDAPGDAMAQARPPQPPGRERGGLPVARAGRRGGRNCPADREADPTQALEERPPGKVEGARGGRARRWPQYGAQADPIPGPDITGFAENDDPDLLRHLVLGQGANLQAVQDDPVVLDARLHVEHLTAEPHRAQALFQDGSRDRGGAHLSGGKSRGGDAESQ